ncbi:MAG: hypothetical protein KDK91_27890 [Gammaproteobacteria bacterium]|nr:hypothetical protein [Gammaproteobacteria bacterium]
MWPADRLSGPYERVTLSLLVECRSPMHLGSGRSLPRFAENEALDCAALCVDPAGRRFIPGASWRGLLRALVVRLLEDRPAKEATLEALFGSAKRAQEGSQSESPATLENIGRQGALRVFDTLVSDSVSSSTQTQVAIDPVTGTALEAHLFSTELLPAGTQLELRLLLERVEGEQVSLLLDALQRLDSDPLARLGSGKSQGWGQLRVIGSTPTAAAGGETVTSHKPPLDRDAETALRFELRVLTRAAFVSWLAETAQPGTELADYFETVTLTRPRSTHLGDECRLLELSLRPLEPLLIGQAAESNGDPARHEQRRNHLLARVALDADGEPTAIVPGSSLKGLLRGRTGRILRTIAHTQIGQVDNQQVDALLARLFGSPSHGRGCLWLSDAVGALPTDEPCLERVLIGIDRFTGGNSSGALFEAHCVFPAALHTRLWLSEAWLPEPERAPIRLLLAFLLRDLLEGDMRLGWGKARGLGGFDATLLGFDSVDWLAWPALMHEPGFLAWLGDRETAHALLLDWLRGRTPIASEEAHP